MSTCAPAYNCMTTNKTFVWTNQQLTVNSFPFGMILRIFSSWKTEKKPDIFISQRM